MFNLQLQLHLKTSRTDCDSQPYQPATATFFIFSFRVHTPSRNKSITVIKT